MDFVRWLTLTGALANTNPAQISIHDPRKDVTSVIPMAGAQHWIYTDNPVSVQHFTVDTPVLAKPEASSGRVVYSDFHVLNPTQVNPFEMPKPFPMECDDMPLTAQEKVLELMLFDLATCAGSQLPRVTGAAPPPAPAAS
jgi:hypothetical protein